VKPLDDVDGFPWLPGTEQSGGETDCVKRYVILAEELNVLRTIRICPPFPPIPSCRVPGGPGLGRRYVSNRRIKPDIEDLIFEAWPGYRNAPRKIARDAAVPQLIGQPALGQRRDERRPTVSGIDPCPQPPHQLRLAQKDMPARAQFERSVS
jgi:hypothetical protein